MPQLEVAKTVKEHAFEIKLQMLGCKIDRKAQPIVDPDESHHDIKVVRTYLQGVLKQAYAVQLTLLG